MPKRDAVREKGNANASSNTRSSAGQSIKSVKRRKMKRDSLLFPSKSLTCVLHQHLEATSHQEDQELVMSNRTSIGLSLAVQRGNQSITSHVSEHRRDQECLRLSQRVRHH